MALPRILFLASEPPHTAAAGSIVFYRLLRDYPPDRLLVVTNHLPPPSAERLECRYAHLPQTADRFDRTRFWLWKPILRNLSVNTLAGLSKVDDALAGFVPDVVVTLMQNSWYYDLAARYARRRNLPLLLFIHDLPHEFEPVPSWLASRQRHLDRKIYAQASARLCISLGMTEWFKSNFGLTGEVMLPPRDDDTPSQPPEACRELKTPGRLTLGYAGGLHYGYGEQLLALLPHLRATGTRLEYFGPAPAGCVAALAAATDVINFNGYAPTPTQAWRTLLTRCDVILQPYLNPPGPHSLQYRTHFPSKLGDCLSLGLPLLITGPDYASGVSWCTRHKDSALIVTSADPADFNVALTRLRDESDLRITLASGAQTAAMAFDAASLRDKLHQILTRTAST